MAIAGKGIRLIGIIEVEKMQEKMLSTISAPMLVSGCSVSEWEVEYAADAAKNGWNEHCFDYLKRFEEQVCRTLNVRYAIATPSCTAALHLSLLTIGVGLGDEIILPDSTWIATANAVAYTGAVPVFVDSSASDWTIDPEAVEKAVTDKTKAIIAVHLYGHPCKMREIREIAKKHGLYVIEDAAQSMGSEYEGHRTGSLGDMACFSFHGSKIVVMGEGGVFTTNDEKLYQRAKFLGDQAKHPTKRFYNDEIGYKFRLSNLQAAFGLAQMERLDEIVEKKRQVFHWYQTYLKDLPGVTLNPELAGIKNNYWMVTIVLDDCCKIDAAGLLNELEKRNIGGRPFFYPITEFPMYRRFRRQDMPVSYYLHDRGLNLPCGAELTKEEVFYVCMHVKDILYPNSVTMNPISGWLARREAFLKEKEAFSDLSFPHIDFQNGICELIVTEQTNLLQERCEHLHKAGLQKIFVCAYESERELCAHLKALGFCEWQRVPVVQRKGPDKKDHLLELIKHPLCRAEDYQITFCHSLETA